MKKIILTVMIMSIISITAHAETVVLMKTNQGDITIELYDEKAPETVKNFLSYVENSSYDGTIFHRVIPGFMIQGGGFDTKFKQKSTNKPIKNEASKDLKNEKWTVAMARTSEPHSATSQFFINVANNSFLDYKNSTPQGFGYAVFGKVIDGQDIVESISHVKTGNFMGHSDVPKEQVIIESIKILTKGGTK